MIRIGIRGAIRQTDPAALLTRAMLRDAAASGCAVTLRAARSMPWASATFVGARHAWQVEGADAAVRQWAARLPDREFALPGHVLADMAVTRDGARVTIEALTLIEA